MWINEKGRKAYKGDYDTDKLLAEIAKKDEMINKHWKVVVHNQEQVIAELKEERVKTEINAVQAFVDTFFDTESMVVTKHQADEYLATLEKSDE